MSGARMELRGITVTAYDDMGVSGERTLLEDVSFTLGPGEWVFVTGPNGSGKSTFVRLLAGYSGDFAATGTVVRGFAGMESAPYVLQHPDDSFVGSTPWEDVLTGLEQQGMEPDAALRRSREALARVGLLSRRHAPLEKLSGGQKQLAAAAACIAAMPDLLILDEADANLDPVSREAVFTVVRELWRRGAAVVWVSQRLELLRQDDRVAAFQDGRLVYDGGVEGFMATAEGADQSFCERLGYEPPYAAAVALQLRKRGFRLSPLPLTAEHLAKAVAELAGS